jgi:ribulose-phosphate 3-epimerase
MLLLMTVNPGFGGQEFMPNVLEKIKFTRDICRQLNIGFGGKTVHKDEEIVPFDIQVDGGINDENVVACVEAGANVIVAGSSLFKQKNLQDAVANLRKASELGLS